jgi:Predicted membrane protein
MRFIKKYGWNILAFIIPLVFLICFFAAMGCFSGKTILNSDMQGQYVSFFQYLKNVLHGDATFPYTFSKGLGGTMYGAFFYYLSNPLNLLVYFFDSIPNFFLFLVILKLSLCGFTMNLFLSHKFGKNDWVILIFSVIYVLTGYNINYFSNLMWLDGILLAPIILLGIDKIIEGKAGWLYIVTLFISIVVNYYIGFILCVISVIYFFYSLFLKYDWKMEKKLLKKRIIHFFIITFFTGMMTSFILIPCGLEILNVERVYSFSTMTMINWNFFDYIAPLYMGFGNFTNPLNYFGFNIYCGILTLLLVILYFRNSTISKKEKKLTLIVYFILLLPISFEILNYIWHMFTVPVAFNYRYSFFASLFSILIAVKSYLNLKIDKKSLIITFIISLIFSASLIFLTINVPEYYIYLNWYKITLSLLFLLLYILLLFKNKYKLVLVVLCFEIIINIGIVGYESPMSKIKYYNDGLKATEKLSSYCEDTVRCESMHRYTGNDSLLGNYKGITTFISTTTKSNFTYLLNMDGIEGTRNYYYYDGLNPVLDMLLGVKYIKTFIDIADYEIKEVIEEGRVSYIYVNQRALSLGYLVSNKIKELESNEKGISYQEKILNYMIDENNDYYIELTPEKINDFEYKIKVYIDSPYLYVLGNKIVRVNGRESTIAEVVYVSDGLGSGYNVLFNVQEGDVMLLEFDKEAEDELDEKFYSFNVYEFDKFYEKISENQFEILENNGNYIKGTINSEKGGVLFLTIPYEPGWSVMVDGKKAEHYEVIDSFIAIDLDVGEHVIELEYHVPGLVVGIIISIISVSLLIFYQIIYRKHLFFGN